MKPSQLLDQILGRLHVRVEHDPARDWLVLFTCGLFAFVCIVVWNIYTFGVVAEGGVIGKVATSTPVTFDRSSIDKIRTVFEQRAGEEAKYAGGVYRFADPSF